MSERTKRKLDHVRLAVAQGEPGPGRNDPQAPGWADVYLVHQSLPERSLDEIDLSTSLGGVAVRRPILINAMTGGAPGLGDINRGLAEAAAALELPLAVGSQTAALHEPSLVETFRITRRVHPRGVLLANVGAGASVDAVRRAVDMLEANLVQLHCNAPQELVMPEGDRDFRGVLHRIEAVVRSSPVPVVVKECGFGLSREAVRQLYGVGVRVVDVAGRGGTNFIQIEAKRAGTSIDPGLAAWGIPAAAALAEVSALRLPQLQVVASGGIRHGTDVAKALALGATAVGIAGPVLRRWQQGGVEAVLAYLSNLLTDLTRTLLLCGAGSVAQLQQRPAVILGRTAEWCRLRGVDLESLAQRGSDKADHLEE